jgi:site-specific recombinase XerD
MFYPHCLRKAFERAVRNSGLDIKGQEFLIGHVLPSSQDTYYDKTKVEELREKYSQIRFFTTTTEVKKETVLEAIRRFANPLE